MTSASQRLACYNTDTAMATAKRQLRVGELAVAGWSITDIANHLGADHHTIRRDLEDMEFLTPRKQGGQHKPINCGTNSGYYAHRRRGELPCKPCTTAASQTALRNKRRRQQQQRGKEGAGQ